MTFDRLRMTFDRLRMTFDRLRMTSDRLRMTSLFLQPRLMIAFIRYLHRLLGKHQRLKGIHHHCQLIRLGLPDASFHSSRMGAVRDTGRMQGDMARIYVVPAHEIAVDIIQNLVTVNITVTVRCRNTFRMVVV